ncbi:MULTISPECIES: SDR family oxidoreductase [unclassified Ketobacter]|uniref:SDR family oxidoreductase n=1 Tax=unclassified Ketobacter TaxID=2639109 RepID=UPI000F14764A|nr:MULTISPECIES: SDR family oxidoreductase [unclassified Ketobacter]RLT89066.1 MAG: SDR family oxidoreductase [Ketobacter sp. GenoA1]RLT97206.1 MAG: SDR family oxidoreductase [Ketobacter sp.]
MKNWIIIGATSAIAESVCRLWAVRGYSLFLVARNQSKLDTLANDYQVRGAAKVHTHLLDVNATDSHQPCWDAALDAMGRIDGILIAHGTLPDQKACEASYETALAEINTNALSVISLCTLAANEFEKQGAGNIAVISSVAGDRGRQSNYVYGAAKGMVTLFLQGLRNRLFASGVHVLTVKPGFVDTPMTTEFDKGGPLWATPDQVAAGIVSAIDKKRNEVYLPWFWWGVMLIIKNIPEFVFKRLSL